MRTFTAILSFFILLTACDPEIIKENECKADHFDLLEMQWSNQLHPYFQYNKSKWFDMGEYIGLISSDNVVSIINKETGQVSVNSTITVPNEDRIHTFNTKFYYYESSSIDELDPFTGSINTLYDPTAGAVEDFIANDHMMVINLADNLRTSFELVMIDLNTRVSKSLTVLNVDPDIRQYINLSLLHQDQAGKWQLYYNIFSSSASPVKVSKTMKIDLETGEQRILSEPYGITDQSVVINNSIYSAFFNSKNGTHIKKTDLELNIVSWTIDPKPNNGYDKEFHEFSIRKDDIVFYADLGYSKYDLNTGQLIQEVLITPPYEFPDSKPPVLLEKYLFIPYLKEFRYSKKVLGVLDLENEVYWGDYCEIPAVFNNQSHFVSNDELFVINHAKQIQKFTVKK